MNIVLVTDAWAPQVNGVVTTLVELVGELERAGHDVDIIHPGQFYTRPCPGYASIDLAVRPRRQVAAQLDVLQPEAIHIATEGPLGWAARRHCLRRGWAFTTAFHTKFPEILKAAAGVPLAWGYALFRHFHRPSSGVMVPTEGVLRMLERRGFRNLRHWTHGVDTRQFSFQSQTQPCALLGALAHPVALFVGRVSYEKNIKAFLEMDFPGTKVVCGVGPLLSSLRERHPHVHWLGVLPRDELTRVYSASDLFVFPSRSDTFGLVMLEAMACGTPVAAYPVDGPLEVLGEGAAARGGVMHNNLRRACYGALAVPRHQARARASDFSWKRAAQLFLEHLVPARRGVGVSTSRATQGDVMNLSSSR